MDASSAVVTSRFVGLREQVGVDSKSHVHEWHVIGVPLTCHMTVATDAGLLVVPSATAVWMPAGIPHRSTSTQLGEVRSVAMPPSAGIPALQQPCLLDTTPFFRELVAHMASLDRTEVESIYGERLADVLSAHTRRAKVPQISLRMPCDRRLRGIADALLQDPLDERTLDDWSNVVGGSYRTLARHFVVETGCTFQQWRQTLLVAEAVRRLASDEAVGSIAADLGYCSAAGFTTMFKRVTGTSPTEYIKLLRGTSR